MTIDWTLLLLIAIVALGLLGLVIALQTSGGRKRLADAALKLAEALLAYAIGWLERDAGGTVDIPTAAAHTDDIYRARGALRAIRGG